LGVQNSETYAARVGQALGLQSVNLGVTAYGVEQAYARTADALERFEHPVAVVMLFLPQMVARNASDVRPHLEKNADGRFEWIPASPSPRLVQLFRRWTNPGASALEATSMFLQATAEAARSRGAQPLFVVTQYGPTCLPEDGKRSWLVRELFEKPGHPFVEVPLGPADVLPRDSHAGAGGHHRISDAVIQHLRKKLPEHAHGSTKPAGP
jgi:hypothetical protein